MNKQAALARKNLDKRLSAIREALGMTVRQLADGLHVVPSRVSAIENAEETGSITVKTLREAAEALDCEFFYAFVPRKSLDETLRDQITRKTEDRLRSIDHTMRLENQRVDAGDRKDERKRLIDEMFAGTLRGVWDR